MSALDRIAYFQHRRDEVPNQELAKALAEKKDKQGIREIAANLWNENPSVQSDCLKVLYEIGYLDPELIAAYAGDFLKLLKSRNNRLVWGSMIALSTIAELKAAEIHAHHEDLLKAMEKGSVIAVDNAVKTLALVAAGDEARRSTIFPHLLRHLQRCRPKDVPQHAEKTLAAVNAGNKGEFIRVLEKRLPDLTASGATRVRRVMQAARDR